MELKGPIHTWCTDPSGKHKRDYSVITLPFKEASRLFKPDLFKAATGQGEQRVTKPSHINKLRKEIAAGNFTPTSIGVGVRPRHKRDLVVQGDEFILPVKEGDTLPQTDGHHRFKAIEKLIEEFSEDAEMVAMLESLPVTAMLYLDGDTQRDFINLQQRANVDTTHLMSLRIRQKMLPDKHQGAARLAYDTALALHQCNESVFYKMIRFDSRGTSDLPMNSLCSSSASDLSTSLVGLAKVAMIREVKPDSDVLAAIVNTAVDALREHAPDLLGDDTCLTPPPNGTRGSATMLVGVAICLAYRMGVKELTAPDDDDLKELGSAARSAFADASTDMSGQAKRQLMGDFAREYLGGLDKVELHDGVPLGLCHALSASAYAVMKLPRKK